jgi:hypothetical protein
MLLGLRSPTDSDMNDVRAVGNVVAQITYQYHVSQESNMTMLNIDGGSESLGSLGQHIRAGSRATLITMLYRAFVERVRLQDDGSHGSLPTPWMIVRSQKAIRISDREDVPDFPISST